MNTFTEAPPVIPHQPLLTGLGGDFLRMLITGSRHFPDEGMFWMATKLQDVWREFGSATNVLLVHGACHLGGADILAEDIGIQFGWEVEPHPAQGHPDQDFGPWPGAGPKRNAYMVGLGADVCVGFPLSGSRGTKDCIGRAERAGIPVREFLYVA